MGTPTAEELARSAFADRRWSAACRGFAEAERSGEVLTESDLERWSTALFLRGELETAHVALSRAHDAYVARGDDRRAALTANAIAIHFLEAGDVAAAGGWTARGLNLAEHLDDPTVGAMVALVPAAVAAIFVGDAHDAIRRFDSIADVAARFADETLAAHAEFGKGRCLITLGHWAEGFACLDHALAAATSGRVSPESTCLFYRSVLDLAYAGFDLERAERWTRDFARWCDSQPELLAYTGQAHAYRGQLSLLHGAWSDAATFAERAERRLHEGDFTAVYVAPYLAAELQRLRGAPRPAQKLYRRAGGTGFDPQPGLALALLDAGDVRGAQAMIRGSVAASGAGELMRLLAAAVRIELAAGDVTAARRAADDLGSHAASSPPPLLFAVASLADAEVRIAEGRATDALGVLSRAQTVFEETNLPYQVAHCHRLRGRILRSVDESAAAAEFAMARARFTELGARPDVDAVDALTGERSEDALTPREIEVLRLVSTGLTNRGVAERLSLSEKTVARHLSNIYAKLHLSTRSAATAYAYQHDLV